MVPSKCLCPSDPTLTRALEITEQNVELGREVREVRGGLTGRIGRGQEAISHSNGVEQVCQKMESFGNWKVFQSSTSER